MVGEPLASLLRSGRELFNSKFAQAARRFPNLDGEKFSGFVIHVLDPLTRSLPLNPEQRSQWVQVAYDVGLELAGEGLVGVEANGRGIEGAWLRILPKLKPAIVAAADVVLGALSNATHHLQRARGARVDEWIEAMERLGADCESTDELLKLGQVLAWRSGMAQYRESALHVLASLPERLSRPALRIPNSQSVAAALHELTQHRWYDPAATAQEATGRSHVRTVGAFRGFGGDFIAPPRVVSVENETLVSDGADAWQLMADVFGCYLHRRALADFKSAKPETWKVSVSSAGSHVLRVDGREIRLQAPGEVTSVAVTSHTIAVTFSHTHSVYLMPQ